MVSARKVVGLTIAGLDPSGGAGIITDVKTLLAFGWVPTAVITSVTFQNSAGVFGALHQTVESIRNQILPIVDEFQVAAVKIGMLPTRAIVSEVTSLIRGLTLPAPVVDPVVRSTSGHELIESETIGTLLDELMPLAQVITPNIPEAERLTGLGIKDESDMRAAARKLREMGARAVLVKGGHLKHGSGGSGRGSSPTAREGSEQAIDVLDDEGRVTVFRGEWIGGPPIRGTGCMMSTAIAARLGHGSSLEEAVGAAKNFINDAFRKQRLADTKP